MSKEREILDMPADQDGLTEEEFLRGYDMKKYDRPSVTVDSVVIAQRRGRAAVLLIKRKNHPFIGKWAFPGGFLNMDESPEQGAARELDEEAGVAGIMPRQIGAYGRVDRDPRGRIITIAYLSILPEGAVPKAADDAADAGLFYIEPDAESKTVRLYCPEKETELNIAYRIENGAAEYIGSFGMAGDHAQILIDALRLYGMELD